MVGGSRHVVTEVVKAPLRGELDRQTAACVRPRRSRRLGVVLGRLVGGRRARRGQGGIPHRGARPSPRVRSHHAGERRPTWVDPGRGHRIATTATMHARAMKASTTTNRSMP